MAESKVQVIKTVAHGTQVLYLAEGEALCRKCKGRGRWDSCYGCGNRGFTIDQGA